MCSLTTVQWGTTQEVDDAFNTVMVKLFGQIFDLESDRGDFLQVRFWPAVNTLTTSTFTRHLKRLKRARSEAQSSSPLGNEMGSENHSESGAGLPSDEEREKAVSTEELILMREGLNAIENPDHRTSFILRFYSDWQIETKEAGKPTICEYFGKTPRTINNWLRKAAEDLSRWRGETT